MDGENPDNEFEVVIIESCENCETHQQFSKHSEWKYFEQFNELKRKIEKYVGNTVVIKNPVPDELVKSPQLKLDKNAYINKDTNEKITYPRIGAFQIYIYNVLIFSKLLSNNWPNHYRLLQTISNIIEENKKGNSLDHFSVYRQNEVVEQEHNQHQISPEKKGASKKKRVLKDYRAYRSKERAIGEPYKEKKLMALDPIDSKKKRVSSIVTDDFPYRSVEMKGQARGKLPAIGKNGKDNRYTDRQDKQQPLKKIFNQIEEFEKEEISMIQNNKSDMDEDNKKFDSLLLQNPSGNDIKANDSFEEEMKIMENRSVQYEDRDWGKDYMNRSIQYGEDEELYASFSVQCDDGSRPKEVGNQYIQTADIQIVKQEKKPAYMLDQAVQADIHIPLDTQTKQIQTFVPQQITVDTNTQILTLVNRGHQYPDQENAKGENTSDVIDNSFSHLFQNRRNIIDNHYYSIDRFEEKATKYKWIGKANANDAPQLLRRKMLLECLVFSVYNYYGIKTPEKRLSFQKCSNVVGEKLKDACLHVMTFDNPELQYPFQFEECDYEGSKFPLAELLTFKNSKQNIKFTNYGSFLAVAYLLNDYEIYDEYHPQLGFVVTNYEVKEIHKLSASNYELNSQIQPLSDRILVDISGNNFIHVNRLSEVIQLEFIAMLARITDPNILSQLLKYIRQIFIHMSPSYQQYRMAILSASSQKIEEEIVQSFIDVIKMRAKSIKQNFKGNLYTYTKYHSLTPIIKYKIPFEHRVERKLKYEGKIVTVAEVQKHLRNKDHIVVIYGENGIGKSELRKELVKSLNETQKMKIIEINSFKKDEHKARMQMSQIMRNIVFIDNAQLHETQLLDFLKSYRTKETDLSYCILTSSSEQTDKLRSIFSRLKVIGTQLLALDEQQIKNFMMKNIKNQTFTDKKDFIELVMSKPKHMKVLCNPFYMNYFCQQISRQNLDTYHLQPHAISKYLILKTEFNFQLTEHSDEMREMGIKCKDPFADLRRVAFEYFHNVMETNEVIEGIFAEYEENELIRNQLSYYPFNLESMISGQPLFVHGQFFNFFLVEAYSYFVEKGFRNMRMNKFYTQKALMQMITQRYTLEKQHIHLLEQIYSSKIFKNIGEQCSNALTLLSKMRYTFTNLNFDDTVIPDADLSNGLFYSCSFRNADLSHATLYKTQMLACHVEGAVMDHISIFAKKYEIQFTALTASLSVDSRSIALGCGNYLIVISTENGKELKRIEAHLDVIRTVKYSKDGTSLISIADDKTLRIWDTRTYKSVVFKLPQKGSINFSNETETIASVSKNNLKVWNIKSMANEVICEGHQDLIVCVNFSVDGNLILTGSRDSTLRLWTVKGGKKHIYKGHNSEIITGKITPNNRTIVSSSKKKDVAIWEIESENIIKQRQFGNEITELCLDNKEKYIISTFSNDSTITVLDFLTLETVHILHGHKGKILNINFDVTYNKLISLSKDRSFRLWDFQRIMNVEKNSQKLKIHTGPILGLAYDKVNDKYVTSHENGEINLWNAEDDAHLDQFVSHNGPVKCLAFDAAGKIYSAGTDGVLRIWNLAVRREPRNIEVHTSQILQLKLNEKNQIIATSSVANELVIQDFTGIKMILSTREEGRINAIEFSKDGKVMAIGGADRYIVIYEISNMGNTITRQEQLGQHTDVISSLTFQGDSLLIAALKNGEVSIWNHFKGNLIKKIENVSPISSLLTFQKKYVCFSSEDGRIRAIDMEEGREAKVFKYSETTNAMDFNADESLLYVGTSNGNLIKWSLNSVHPVKTKLSFNRKAINSECTKAVTVESGKSVLVKDLFYHQEEVMTMDLDSQIEGVAFSGDKLILLLKNGKYWEAGKKQYHFETEEKYQGQLHSIRDRFYSNFYRTPIKKIKGLNAPTQRVLEEVI